MRRGLTRASALPREDFVLNKKDSLGIGLDDQNVIVKIESGSLAARDGTFKLGDTIVAVRTSDEGRACSCLRAHPPKATSAQPQASRILP